MELLFNDLSLHGQFSSVAAFRDAIERVMKMRVLVQRFGRDLYCNRKILAAYVTNDLQISQAVQFLDRSAQRAVMGWITRHGPFWEDAQQHSPDDYLVCGDEIVTERGIGEAAYGCFHGLDWRLVSLSPSLWLFSPVPITWHQDDNTATVNIENYWEADRLEEALNSAPMPVGSWKGLEEAARTRFPALTFSEDTFTPLLSRPFSSGAANQILQILNVLQRRKGSFDDRGRLTDAGRALDRKHFAGATAWFSDSSETEKSEFRRQLTFRHPLEDGVHLFCTWQSAYRIPPNPLLLAYYAGPSLMRGLCRAEDY